MAGEKSGHGVYYASNGDRYEGDYSSDQRNGRGVFSCGDRSGQQFAGEWKQGKMVRQVWSK